MAIIQGNAVSAGGFYPKEIEQSLRFNDDDSAYLSWTPASAGNRKTWTFSTWVKRGNLGTAQGVFSAQNAANNHEGIIFIGDCIQYNASLPSYSHKTTAVFRDVSAWYHVCVVVDTTQATDVDRVKIYVNGELQTDVSGTYLPLNYDTRVNNTVAHSLGYYSIDGGSTRWHLDGYLAETHFIDGTAYTADDFGEFKNGVWIPKAFAGSYGTNGFYLNYADGGALGTDSSGNGNTWTPTNLAATDVMLDSPTNNFATLNPLDKASWTNNATISEGNLELVSGSAQVGYVNSTIKVNSGTYYFEAVQTSYNATGNQILVGIGSGDGVTIIDWRRTNEPKNGVCVNDTLVSGFTAADGDVIGFACDFDTGVVKVYWNGTLNYTSGALNLDASSPFALCSGTNIVTLNFGQDSSFAGNKVAQGNTDANGRGDFYYAPPAGYLALCTANLPEPAIGPNSATTADEHFNTVLYTGTGSTQSITGVGFQPDFVWTKRRNLTAEHAVVDAVRQANNALFPSNTGAEDGTAGYYVTSLDSDGFSVNLGTESNASGSTYVAWNWKADNTSGSSNTDGSITSTVAANVDAGFSIATFTVPTSGVFSVGHGLTKVPDLVITKATSITSGWVVHHSSQVTNGYLLLNTTDAQTTTNPNIWPSAATASVVNYGTDFITGSNYQRVTYCFHSVEGYSKFGSYTGNGSADGPFVYTGFRPAFVMIKRTDTAGNNWIVMDTDIDTYNVMSKFLLPNTSEAEGTSAASNIDFLSNGFKPRNNNSDRNASGATYIYMAFAENPFKYSNAR